MRALVIIALTLVTGCESKDRASAPAEPPPPVTIAVVTGLSGERATLDRVGLRLQALRADGPMLFFVVGNTFFAEEDPPAARFEAVRAEAERVAAKLAELSPTAILPGPWDHGVHATKLDELVERYHLPVLSPPRTVTTRYRADTALRTIGGLRVGFVGIPADMAGETDAYVAAAIGLRVQKADFVLGLLPRGGGPARTFTRRLDKINVAVGGGDETLRDPVMLLGTLLVEAGDRGRHLGLLRLFRPTAGPVKDWVYNDQGREARRGLEVRIERFAAEVKNLPPGPARSARAEKLIALRAELAALERHPPKVPGGPYVTWDTESLVEEGR